MTGPGTNTYIVGNRAGVVVIDPGPDEGAHLDAVAGAAAAAGRRHGRVSRQPRALPRHGPARDRTRARPAHHGPVRGAARVHRPSTRTRAPGTRQGHAWSGDDRRRRDRALSGSDRGTRAA